MEAARQRVRNFLNTLSAPLAPEVLSYSADAAAGLVEDMADADAETIAAEMRDTIGPLLEGVLDDAQLEALCASAARASKGLPQKVESVICLFQLSHLF